MQVSKATSSITRLFVSLDIHYNSSLNTEVQMQNEFLIQKIQTTIVDSMILGIHCNRFVQ